MRITLGLEQIFWAAFPMVFATILMLILRVNHGMIMSVIPFIAYAQGIGYMEGRKK